MKRTRDYKTPIMRCSQRQSEETAKEKESICRKKTKKTKESLRAWEDRNPKKEIHRNLMLHVVVECTLDICFMIDVGEMLGNLELVIIEEIK